MIVGSLSVMIRQVRVFVFFNQRGGPGLNIFVGIFNIEPLNVVFLAEASHARYFEHVSTTLMLHLLPL
jgi:hypothetical protein